MNQRFQFLLATGAIVLVLTGLAPIAGAQTAPEIITGRIIDAAGSIPGKTSAHFTIRIDKYTPGEEVKDYALLLAEKGQDALLNAIGNLDNGYIRVGTSLGYPLSITRSLDAEGGRIVRVVTDRPLQMFEVMRNTRSKDHPFGIIEMRFDEEGKGEGKMIAAAQVSFNEEGVLVIENYATRPFDLVNVEIEKAE